MRRPNEAPAACSGERETASGVGDIHRQHLRESTWTTVGWALGPLRDHLALVHHGWTITGERDGIGTPRLPRSGIFTWVVSYTGTTWQIAAAHNTNLRADTDHRLANQGRP